MYIGLDEIYRSDDIGDSWYPVTSGLTGGALFNALAVARSNSNFVYASTGGNIFKSTDGGNSWVSVTMGIPTGSSQITYIAVKPTDEQTVYVSLSGYASTAKVYKTTNGGASWTNITATGLPNVPANCIEVENNAVFGVYLGTDLGVYYTNDTLTAWVPYNSGLPNVIIDELEINYISGKIRAGTYGRGLWESDLYTITGVKEKINENSFSLYPNPAKNELYIQGITGDLEVTNEIGQVVLRSTLASESNRIDVSSLKAGVYFATIRTADKTSRQKFVIE
jgi:hypothetical protein